MLKDLRQMGVDRPLPDSLRRRLLAIPGEAARDWDVVPQAALPGALRQRLVRIPETAGQGSKPPEWLLSARYAAAASLLLATLTFSAFGNPMTRGQEAAGALSQLVQNVLSEARDQGRTTLTATEHAVAATEDAVQESFDSARQSVMGTVDNASERWTAVATTVQEWTSFGSAPSDADPPSVSSDEGDKEKENGRTENGSSR